jgi:prepilin-type N-terminal cleavage/methylation domain-containing protein
LKLNSYPPKQFVAQFSQKFQRGVTLIELMVALVLALLIIAAVGYVYLQGSQGFRVQDSQSRMQEDARFIIDTVGRDVRVAGAFGCNLPREEGMMLSGTPGTSVELMASQPIMTEASIGTGWLMASGNDTTPNERFVNLQYVLRGFSPTAASTAVPLPAYIRGSSRQPGTDVLMVMRAGEDARSVTSSTETTLTMDGYLTPANKAYPVLAVSDCRQTKIIKPTMTGPASGPVLLKVENGMNRNNNAPSGQVDELNAKFGQYGTPTISHFEPVLYYVAAPTPTGLRSTLHRVGIANDALNWGGWEGTGGALIASGVEAFNLSFVLSGDPAIPKEFTTAQMEAGSASRWAAVTAVRLQFTLSAESDGTALTAQSNVAGGPVRADNRLVQRYDVTLGVSSRQNPRN